MNDSTAMILHLFTHRLSTCAERVLAELYFGHCLHPGRSAARALTQLERQGYLGRVTMQTAVKVTPAGPLEEFLPGNPEPDFAVLAYRLRTRWAVAATRAEVFWFATRKAGKRFGGYAWGHAPRRCDADHHHFMGTVYGALDAADRARWISEYELVAAYGWPRRGLRPDALLRRGKGRPEVVIEVGGKGGNYNQAALREFHEAFCDRQYRVY